jgi:putative CocE/NonD family hydrolase
MTDVLDRLKHTQRALPVTGPETVSMTTRDGVRLDADVYRPATGGPYPVLLQRQAYGRRIACTICYAHPAWYAAQGYIVVVQEIRGRGTSEGRFNVGEYDVSDGAESVEWAARLEGSTGAVGMYGFSYQGYNQLMAALGDSPALKALAPAMFPWDVRTTWAWENDAFRLGGALGWAIQIAAETARHAGDAKAYADLLAASRNVPFLAEVQCRPPVIEKYRDLSHYHDWIDREPDDPYWARISPSAHLEEIAARKLPMLMIGGWYDSQLRGTLQAYRDLASRNGAPVHLAIGPWLHFPWDRKAGAIDFGPDAASRMDELHVRWFDHWLKGEDRGFAQEPPVRLFDMGAKRWAEFDAWPDAAIALTLSGNGMVSVDPQAGRLLRDGDSAQQGVDYLAHDPWRPAPSLGGTFGSPPGPVDRSVIDARGDVLTFTTAPFNAPFTIAGDVSVDLFVESPDPSFDLGCVLSRVAANGQAIPLADGYRTLRAHDATKSVHVPMRATCITVQPGEALRLSISGAAFPAFPVNPGTGADPTTASSVEARVTTVGIRYGASSPSRLNLSAAP